MFTYHHYVPILHWKGGEKLALRDLFPKDKSIITPLLEIPKDEAKAPRLLAGEVGKFWGQEKAFFDLYPAMQVLQSNHSDPVSELFEYSKNSGQNLIPVTSFNRDFYYQNAVKTVVARQKDGLCLRLLYEDIEKDFLVRKIEEICSDFRLDPSSIDIVLDLKIFSHHNRPFEWYCEKLPHLTEWRTFTIASGAFPKDLTGFKVGQHILPRLDWQSWRQEIGKPLPRIPTYGDYATLHPFLPSYIPGMNASASIRYTYDEYWIIMRGEGVLNPGGAGYAQFPANAQLLIEQPEYCGPHFSIGDNFIYEISLNKGKVGNLSQWLQATVNHHLTFAARQIANLSNQKE